MKRYSNSKLREFIDSELIYPRGSKFYRKILSAALKTKGWDEKKLHEPNGINDVIHDQLWMDVCGIVGDLSELLLEERQKNIDLIKELKQDLKSFSQSLGK